MRALVCDPARWPLAAFAGAGQLAYWTVESLYPGIYAGVPVRLPGVEPWVKLPIVLARHHRVPYRVLDQPADAPCSTGTMLVSLLRSVLSGEFDSHRGGCSRRRVHVRCRQEYQPCRVLLCRDRWFAPK